MIKLCIIDDEEEIREGIANNVDWESHGISICGLAGDGTEAIRLCEEQLPDIIILDINMPGESGLEVAGWINQTKHPTKVLILSGHDNFSYVQQALRYGVTDYLLKPCRSSDILASVLKVKETIEHERQEERALKELKAQYANNLPVLRERFLLDLMLRQKKGMRRIPQSFALYQVRIDPQNLCAAVVMIDDSTNNEVDQNEKTLMRLAVRNILEEIMSGFSYELFEYSGDIILLYNSSDHNDVWIGKRMQEVQDMAPDHLWFPISVGIGTVYSGTENIFDSYFEAFRAAEAGLFFSSPTITYYGSLRPDIRQHSFLYPTAYETRIIESISACNHKELTIALDNFVKNIKESASSTEAAKNACLTLLVRLTDLARKKGIDLTSLSGHTRMIDLKNIDILHDKLLAIAEHIIDSESEAVSFNQIISNTIGYIHKYYKNDLSLELVAHEVYVTPKYLSMLFKRSVGQNFTDYLHGVRIQKACELLQDTQMMVYDVAYSVGYKSAKHFSKIFFKQIGMSPRQFRNMSYALSDPDDTLLH